VTHKTVFDYLSDTIIKADRPMSQGPCVLLLSFCQADSGLPEGQVLETDET